MINNFILYINNNISYINDINDLNKIIKKFSFDSSINIIDYYNVIKCNEVIYNIISNFVNLNKDIITSSGLSNFKFCDEVNSFIELYCDNNNIEIYKDYDIDSINYNNIYFKEAKEYPLLTKEEEYNLFKEYERTHDIRIKNKIIESNLRLVLYVASKYRYNGAFDNTDIIQEGNIGLINAIDKFDVNLGYKFSTYAYWWIKQSIHHAISDKGYIIKKQSKYLEYLHNYEKIKSLLTNTLFREPTIKEIADEMHITESYLNNLLSNNISVVSLNVKLDDNDGSGELGDIIVDKNYSVEDEYFSEELKEQIIKLFEVSRLNDQEKRVLILRYGLLGEKPHTLKSIGFMLGITRERIRQVEVKALRKLNYYCSYTKHLNVYNDLKLYLK